MVKTRRAARSFKSEVSEDECDKNISSTRYNGINESSSIYSSSASGNSKYSSQFMLGSVGSTRKTEFSDVTSMSGASTYSKKVRSVSYKAKVSWVRKYKKKKQKKAMRLLLMITVTVIQIFILFFFYNYYFDSFDFGKELTVLVIMFNSCMFVIRNFVVLDLYAPPNDPGIVIWWLCCLRIGQKGSFTEKAEKKRYNELIKTSNQTEKEKLDELLKN